MKKMQEIRKEIEMVRKELDVVAAAGVNTEECYQISLRLDRLIEDYMLWHEGEIYDLRGDHMT